MGFKLGQEPTVLSKEINIFYDGYNKGFLHYRYILC